MVSTDQSRHALEECWRKRVEEARGRYLYAKNESAQVIEAQAGRLTPFPDGSFAVKRALRLERYALAEYVRTLRTFSDLVMNKEIRDEWSQSA